MEEGKESIWQIVLVCSFVALLLVVSLVCMCMSWRSISNNERWCICQICCLILSKCRRNTKAYHENGMMGDKNEDGDDAGVSPWTNGTPSLDKDRTAINSPGRDFLWSLSTRNYIRGDANVSYCQCCVDFFPTCHNLLLLLHFLLVYLKWLTFSFSPYGIFKYYAKTLKRNCEFLNWHKK